MAEQGAAKENAKKEEIKKTKQSGVPLWLKISLIAAAVLVGFFILLIVLAGSATKDVADKATSFTNYLVRNDVADAYAMTSKGFRTATTQAELTQYFDKLYSVFGNGTVKIQEQKVETSTQNGNNGVATFTITKNGKAYWAKIQLIKEDDVWKVINFQTSENQLNAVIE